MNELANDEILQLKLIPHNKHLVDARRKAGYTQIDLSMLTGVNKYRIYRIETLKELAKPNEKDEIASALSLPVEYLFPEELEESMEVGLFETREKSLTGAQTRALYLGRARDEIEGFERTYLLRETIAKQFATLKPQEERVLVLRFGLEDGKPRTLQQIGDEYNVTRDRIRQIEHKALRKLRHPMRSRGLRPYA